MTAPVASVVVPCRNAEKTVRAAVSGALSSPLREIEVIAVDDGSTDGTRAVLDAVASEDPRVRVLSLDGRGVSAARNAGMDAARGEFLFFADADDVAEPEFYSEAVAAMRADGADYCRVAHDEIFPLTGQKYVFPLKSRYRFVSNDEIVSEYIPCFFGYSFAQVREWYAGTPLFARREMATVWSGAFRLDVVRRAGLRFDENIEINEDAMFLCGYLLNCNRTVSVDKVLYHYLISADGALRTKSSGPRFFANKLRLLEKREELDIASGGRLTSMYPASCVFSLLEILRASFRLKGCFFTGLSAFRRYGSDPVVKVSLRHFPLSWRRPVLAAAVLACRFLSPVIFGRRKP